MTLALGILTAWLLLSPLAAVVVGVAIARADETAQRREVLLRRLGGAAHRIPAPSPPPEVVQLRLAQRA